jgi:hypothetical protein
MVQWLAQSARLCCCSGGDEFESEYCFYFHAIWINKFQTVYLGFYIISTLYSWLPRSEKHAVDTQEIFTVVIHWHWVVQLSIDDDMQLQIFNELWGKIQHILRVVNTIVAARKNGWGGLGDADSMNVKWFGII